MAVKHIKQYYETVTRQYKEMQENIQRFEQESQNGMVEPERIENLHKIIEPIKANWEQLSYLMYLLNLPNRKEKQSKYKKENKIKIIKLAEENSPEKLIERNNDLIGKI